jgi:hypothetical protein
MEKNYKNQPFRDGDMVYHPEYGLGVVLNVDCSEVPVYVNFNNGLIHWFGKDIESLSFTEYKRKESNWNRPFEPKEGDVLVSEFGGKKCISILKGRYISASEKLPYYTVLYCGSVTHYAVIGTCKLRTYRFATEAEKEELFSALERDGKRWNAEKKCVEDKPYEPQNGDFFYHKWKHSDSSWASNVGIFSSMNKENIHYHVLETLKYSGCVLIWPIEYNASIFREDECEFRPATESEKQQLLDALAKDGRRWNPEKKVIEDIPQEPKIGDLVIAWNIEEEAIIGRINEITYNRFGRIGYYMISGYGFCFAVKFKSMEQYEKIISGK